MEQTVIAWTRQVSQVWEEIQRTGRYLVLEEYVRAKNMGFNDMSNYYVSMYRWITEGCRRRMDAMPADGKFPVWLALTEAQRLGPAEGTVSLTLEIPRECVYIVDYDRWGYVLNYWYLPRDAADEKAHNEELAHAGIGNEALLFTSDKGNYYPALKSKIVRSWERVFDDVNENMDMNVGMVWEIKREWVKDVEVYD